MNGEEKRESEQGSLESSSFSNDLTIQKVPELLSRIQKEVGKVVFGMDEISRLTLISLMVGGHVLLEGPPGVAKTLFVRSLSACLGLQGNRLQCTPDLMPGDVLGANIFDFKTQGFHLTKGPIFTELLLVDEINRTPPKTQSALLEAMQERTVSIDGKTYPLSSLFTVIATQNPIEQEGTYPLPEAQLDRFLFKLQVGYPHPEAETDAVWKHCLGAKMPDPFEQGIQKIIDSKTLKALQLIPAQVQVERDIAKYAVHLAKETREHPAFFVGISPRAATMLVAASRAHALLEGRDFVIPDDVKALFKHVAHHRVILSTSAEMEGLDKDSVLEEILASVAIPR